MLSLMLALVLNQPPLLPAVAWEAPHRARVTWHGDQVLCVGKRPAADTWRFLGCDGSGFVDTDPHAGDAYTLSPSGGGDVLAVVALRARVYLPVVR